MRTLFNIIPPKSHLIPYGTFGAFERPMGTFFAKKVQNVFANILELYVPIKIDLETFFLIWHSLSKRFSSLLLSDEV